MRGPDDKVPTPESGEQVEPAIPAADSGYVAPEPVGTPPAAYVPPAAPLAPAPQQAVPYAPPAQPIKAPPSPGSGPATASMVIGLVGIMVSCVGLIGLGWLSLVLAAIGLILGFVGLKSPDRKGQAVAGILLNSFWVLVALVLIVFWAVLWAVLGGILSAASN